jgi:hypothetical protein
LREATVMVLYVSVVEIAELAGLPEHRLANGHVDGVIGGALLAVIWGTALGLALAHWFAFGIAAPGLRGLRPTKHHLAAGLAQFGGAVFVAAVSSIPVLFLSEGAALETTGDVPAVIIGIVAYLVARATGRARLPAAVYGVTALALGVVVALVKSTLAGH